MELDINKHEVGVAGSGVHIKYLKFDKNYTIERLSCGGLKLYNADVTLEIRETNPKKKYIDIAKQARI